MSSENESVEVERGGGKRRNPLLYTVKFSVGSASPEALAVARERVLNALAALLDPLEEVSEES